MIYSKATQNETNKVFSVYSAAITNMEQQDIHQWDEIYPDLQIIAEDISKNQMYTGIIDEKVAVCFVLSEECDEEYNNATLGYSYSFDYCCGSHPFKINGKRFQVS